MATESDPHHYNYHRLDEFLKKDYDPSEIGRQLDEVMAELVHLSSGEESYGQTLRQHHYILRELRDIFWSMKEQA